MFHSLVYVTVGSLVLVFSLPPVCAAPVLGGYCILVGLMDHYSENS